tara:strand:+ start:4814 stop:5371 length:558 start_codon:yes stop_codon:yes gene_type:complete
MNLEYLQRQYTDKNGVHSYLPLYEKILSPIRESAENVLEIGIAQGGSIKLWYDYFKKATIYGCDIQDVVKIPEIKNNNRIILDCINNAYEEEYVKKTFLDKEIKFDFMLDDGSHTLEHQVAFIKLYSPLMKNNGILMIEDIQQMQFISTLKSATPEHLKQYIEIYDLRRNKNRYDDIVFCINKNK